MRALLLWTVAALGASCATPSASDRAPAPQDSRAPDSEEPALPLPWTDAPCETMDDAAQTWPTEIARYTAEDDAAPPVAGQVVAVGSSSIRRWESAWRTLAPWGLVQRGLGGARITDVVLGVDTLVLRHHPSAVVLFAGTNDIAFGVEPERVVDGFRCLVEKVHAAQGAVPILFVGITPTPSRWSMWDRQQAVNEAVAALATQHPMIRYVDVPSAVLATGGPPDPSLFDADQLHLSEAGYALWDGIVREAVADAVPPRPTPTPAPIPPGSHLRVDLGPSNPEDGQLPPSPDAFGNHWNAWPGATGSVQILAGEHLDGLVTTTGVPTGVALTLTGGFRSNGLRNGGLTAPSGDLLQTMAVPEATADFFYTETNDDPGGLVLTGLDPAATYTLRLFASRADPSERRVSRYVVLGATERTVELLTTGAEAGPSGGNEGTVAVLEGLAPSAWGSLEVDVQRAEGRFAYLSLLELSVDP